MESKNRDRLGELNGYQIAGLAILASTAVALGVVFVLRRSGILGAPPLPHDMATQPAVPHVAEARTPHHFSEELLVPRMTYTGEEVAEQDREFGHSPEGV